MANEKDDYAHMKRDKVMSPMTQPVEQDYPYGLRLRLNAEELEKIGLDIPKVGEMVHIMAMCEVVSCTAQARKDGGAHHDCELQITHMKAEIEDEEDDNGEEKDERTPAQKIYGKK